MHIRVFSLFLMIPSTDLSKNFHSSFFSLSPLPVKFWWGLVENCKFFIPKFTIFKSLKNFQKKSEIWVRKTGGVFEHLFLKMATFEKSGFFELWVPREVKFWANWFDTYKGGSTRPLKGQKLLKKWLFWKCSKMVIFASKRLEYYF